MVHHERGNRDRGISGARAGTGGGAGQSGLVAGHRRPRSDRPRGQQRPGSHPLLAPGGTVRALAGDITDAAHRQALVAAAAELGGLDLLVNNAGTLGTSPLPVVGAYPLDDLRVALEVNVVAPLGLTQAALPLLTSSPHPRLLNITSDAAVEAYEGWGGYGAGKAALEHLGAVLAVEYPSVTVWSVDPGDLRTAMHQEAFPGEDISDRPEPASVVPAFLALINSDRPSGRYRASELVGAGVPA